MRPTSCGFFCSNDTSADTERDPNSGMTEVSYSLFCTLKVLIICDLLYCLQKAVTLPKTFHTCLNLQQLFCQHVSPTGQNVSSFFFYHGIQPWKRFGLTLTAYCTRQGCEFCIAQRFFVFH